MRGPSGHLGLPQWQPFAIVPHWNLHGQAQTGTYASGAAVLRQRDGRQVALDWPSGLFPYHPARPVPEHWHGSLLGDKRDASGLLYRRNRYYDPATARFTQEDPIVLAGGLNAYRFAAGDPSNLRDPFGLCPIGRRRTTDTSDCPNNEIGDALRLLDRHGGFFGQSTLQTIMDRRLKIDVRGGMSFLGRCGEGTGGACTFGRTIFLHNELSTVDLASALAHEVTHQLLDEIYPIEEMYARNRQLDVLSRMPESLRQSSKWYRELQFRNSNPGEYFLRVCRGASNQTRGDVCPY